MYTWLYEVPPSRQGGPAQPVVAAAAGCLLSGHESPVVPLLDMVLTALTRQTWPRKANGTETDFNTSTKPPPRGEEPA